jgi:hypothetical protein
MYEGECFAIVWVILLFLCYFYGSLFMLIIDHQPFNFLMELNHLIGKLSMWDFIL